MEPTKGRKEKGGRKKDGAFFGIWLFSAKLGFLGFRVGMVGGRCGGGPLPSTAGGGDDWDGDAVNFFPMNFDDCT